MSLMKRILLSLVVTLTFSCGSSGLNPQQEADRFLSMYDGIGQKLYAVTSEAYWKSATDVTEQHVGERIGAESALAAFSGSRYVIETTRSLLASTEERRCSPGMPGPWVATSSEPAALRMPS